MPFTVASCHQKRVEMASSTSGAVYIHDSLMLQSVLGLLGNAASGFKKVASDLLIRSEGGTLPSQCPSSPVDRSTPTNPYRLLTFYSINAAKRSHPKVLNYRAKQISSWPFISHIGNVDHEQSLEAISLKSVRHDGAVLVIGLQAGCIYFENNIYYPDYEITAVGCLEQFQFRTETNALIVENGFQRSEDLESAPENFIWTLSDHFSSPYTVERRFSNLLIQRNNGFRSVAASEYSHRLCDSILFRDGNYPNIYFVWLTTCLICYCSPWPHYLEVMRKSMDGSGASLMPGGIRRFSEFVPGALILVQLSFRTHLQPRQAKCSLYDESYQTLNSERQFDEAIRQRAQELIIFARLVSHCCLIHSWFFNFGRALEGKTLPNVSSAKYNIEEREL
ncbi:uncharacterized protein BDR25DRAFT_352972 [Lindgomyces ingoldianus]|uniref:Uncharacterized protein n=1 Tax=Lindgomyces ingoldianus TaxID=673940 RepID=A0ACB6R2C4_9PLEO|nr:uncharacterized protein BDR25DRAFT_352972 [Lindgomyces ingoldianus]KAF2472662.1 hypothetical protein BDR25DRAFT_352972 [Lindgomyces ingoldianus]